MVFFVGTVIVFIFLQIFLSKSKSKWMGLIIPTCIEVFILKEIIPDFFLVNTGSEFLALTLILIVWTLPSIVLFRIYYILRVKK